MSGKEDAFSEESALRAIRSKWPLMGKKFKNLHDINLGGDCSWAEVIEVYENAIARHLEFVTSNPGMPRRLKIAHRVIIDKCVRASTDTAHISSLPLYVSHGFIKKIFSLGPSYGGEREHVIPISLCSGTKMIANPDLFKTFRMVAVGPICQISAEEHKKLDTRENSDPEYPFRRYHDKGVRVYRTDTGECINALLWSFEDHLSLMSKFEAYKTGVTHYCQAWLESRASA